MLQFHRMKTLYILKTASKKIANLPAMMTADIYYKNLGSITSEAVEIVIDLGACVKLVYILKNLKAADIEHTYKSYARHFVGFVGFVNVGALIISNTACSMYRR